MKKLELPNLLKDRASIMDHKSIDDFYYDPMVEHFGNYFIEFFDWDPTTGDLLCGGFKVELQEYYQE